MQENPNLANGEMTEFWAEFHKKQALRRAAWAVAIPAAAFFFISKYWAQIVLAVGANFSLTKEQFVEFFSEPAVLSMVEMLLSLAVFTLPFIISAAIYGVKIGDIAGLTKPRRETALSYTLFGVGFCAFSNIAVSQAGRVFESFGIRYSVPKDPDPEGVFGFMITLAATALFPALLEEFAFRGIVLGILKPFGEGFAIVASAAAFGMLHGNFNQIPFAFMVGLVLGYIRIKTGSLMLTAIVHAANNLVAVVASYSPAMPAGVGNTLYAVYLLLALLAAIVSVVKISADGGFSLKESDSGISARKTARWYYFSPPTVIFYALFLLRALSYLF